MGDQDLATRRAAGGVLGSLRGPRGRRRVVVLADQATSAASNVIVSVLVARRTGVAEFGAFSLAIVAAQVVTGGARSLVGEPMLSLYSHDTPDARRALIARMQGTTLFLGVVSSAVLWLLSTFAGGLPGTSLRALALVLPLVVFQDTWRFAFIVDRPGAALTVDLVWLVALLVGVPLAPADAGPEWFVVAWGVAGGLGAVAGVLLGGRLPGRPHPWEWLVEHREVSWRYFGEFVTGRASSQLVLAALGGIAGLAALGAARASMVFYGLLNTLHEGIHLAVVPEGARHRDEPSVLRRMFTITSAFLMVAAVVWMLLGLVLPDRWGDELFGRTWDDASTLMLPMGLAMVLGGLNSGGLLGLRALADAKASLRARLRSTVWLVLCPLVGAVLGDAWGFAAGFAVARLAAAWIWWSAFRHSLDERATAANAAAAASDPEVEPA